MRESSLRERAQQLLDGKRADLHDLTNVDIEYLIQELQVHQVELELQNEELQNARQALEAARDRYVDLYDFAPVGYLTIGAGQHIEELNLAAADLLAAPRSELIGQPFTRFVFRQAQDQWFLYHRQLTEDERKSTQLTLVRSNGDLVITQIEGVAVAGSLATSPRYRLVVTDISRRVYAEREQTRNAALLRGILDNAADAIYRISLPMNEFEYVNPAARWQTGYGPEDLFHRPAAHLWSRIHPDDKPMHVRRMDLLERSPDRAPADYVEYRLRVKDGSYRWFGSSRVLIKDEHGKLTALVISDRDITERKEQQLQLERQLNDLGVLFEASQLLLGSLQGQEIIEQLCALAVERFSLRMGWVGLVQASEDGEATGKRVVKPAAVCGYDEGFTSAIQIPLDDEEWASVPVLRALESRSPVVVPDTASDETLHAHCREAALARGYGSLAVIPLLDGEKALGVFATYGATPNAFDAERVQTLRSLANLAASSLEKSRLYQQIADHAQQLEARVNERTTELQASEARFRAIMEGAALGIGLCDLEGRLLEVNPALAKLLGREAETLHGQPFAAFLSTEEEMTRFTTRYRELAQAPSGADSLEVRFLTGSGQLCWGHVTLSFVQDAAGANRFGVVMLEEITEMYQTRAALIRAERLTVAGQLAAAFAHEIKNPLQSVVGCLGLLDETVSLEGKSKHYLDVARKELRRATRIVDHLRDLSGPSVRNGRRVATDLRELLDQALLVTGPQAERARVEMINEAPPDLPLVSVIADQILQVFLNLIINALEAMPDGGRLTVTARTTSAPAGVSIVFQDTGVGISPEGLEHLFRFLYTTKDGGTGLGLFVSHDIVTQHRGEISVESKEGVGSTFTVWLPIGREDAEMASPDGEASG